VTLEFALTAPILFLMIFGIIEIGRGFMAMHLLENAARTGCRQGVLSGTSSAQITTAVTNTLTPQGITGASVSVQVNDASADASSATTGDKITVVVSVPVSNFTWVPGGSYLKGNLAGRFSLPRE
jgi:Flp pilus assembly protein TadG